MVRGVPDGEFGRALERQFNELRPCVRPAEWQYIGVIETRIAREALLSSNELPVYDICDKYPTTSARANELGVYNCTLGQWYPFNASCCPRGVECDVPIWNATDLNVTRILPACKVRAVFSAQGEEARDLRHLSSLSTVCYIEPPMSPLCQYHLPSFASNSFLTALLPAAPLKLLMYTSITPNTH
eukprot:6201167-Pleurochrysis_carterae.AAC.4